LLLGVHGGLIVHETKFNGELLATLLSIPPSKTLIRRHLTTHFNDLLGRELVQQKREAENVLGYVPLTPSAKIKVHTICIGGKLKIIAAVFGEKQF